MAKLVILNQGMTGRMFEVNVERTTVGRVEDNTFQIADPSVSSHHAEILLRGPELLIRDLNSTNGTFINGEKISEAVFKMGQTLRFGQVELKIEDGKPAVASASNAGAPGSTPVSTKKPVDSTLVVPRGVSLTDLEQSGVRSTGFDANTSFSKKNNKANKYFIIGGIIVGIVIVVILLIALKQAGAPQ